MIRSLIQFATSGERGVAALSADLTVRRLDGIASVHALAREAIARGGSLLELAEARCGEAINLGEVKLLVPFDLDDPTHLFVTGTGLTHLGSAEGRDKMHKAAAAGQATDTMRMFLMGCEGGKPEPGGVGAQPEWFYKGDGSILVPTGSPLEKPAFAGDGGEEPEIAGIYLNDADGLPYRLGFALGNEFSDHVTERANYLWLAHSKLRQAAIGPELLLGVLPDDVRGTSRIIRGATVVWEKPFHSGEANMSHSIANLEHHHFKNRLFRRPGLGHVHFFGTATLSCADGLETCAGDVFEISADPFALPLTNSLTEDQDEGTIEVRTL
jgi:hypothetical protein